jgi:PAS domain-containing protein
VKLLLNPVALQMALVAVLAMSAFVLGAMVIRRMRKSMVEETESLGEAPTATEGMPVHTYHAVIQQLKQQKHELTTQQMADRRKAKASDTLSATVLANLSCGVLFFNTSGLVRQANPAGRKLLGFASPVGMRVADLFGTANIRPEDARAYGNRRVDEALASALSGDVVIRALGMDYLTPEGQRRVFEVTVSPVLGEDASLMGSTLVLTDKTEIASIRQDQQMRQEVSAEMALGLRNSLTTIAGYAQQLARSRDPELARQLADDVANEAARLDRTIGSFLAGAKAATAGS